MNITSYLIQKSNEIIGLAYLAIQMIFLLLFLILLLDIFLIIFYIWLLKKIR